MTVEQVIAELSKYPKDWEVYDGNWELVEKVYQETWEHTNYPYDKPAKQVVIIF